MNEKQLLKLFSIDEFVQVSHATAIINSKNKKKNKFKQNDLYGLELT